VGELVFGDFKSVRFLVWLGWISVFFAGVFSPFSYQLITLAIFTLLITNQHLDMLRYFKSSVMLSFVLAFLSIQLISAALPFNSTNLTFNIDSNNSILFDNESNESKNTTANSTLNHESIAKSINRECRQTVSFFKY
jgi:hypothetical protein